MVSDIGSSLEHSLSTLKEMVSGPVALEMFSLSSSLRTSGGRKWMKDTSGMDGCGNGGSYSSWRPCRPRRHLLAKYEARQSALPLLEACSPLLVSTKSGMVELLRAHPAVLTHDHNSLSLIEPIDGLAQTKASFANRDHG